MEASAAVGLRERKKADTRFALRRAAVELSRPEGPDAVSVEAICERAGVAKRTFFNYFPSKDDAVLGWSEDDLAWLERLVVECPADDEPLRAVERALTTLVEAAGGSAIWRAQRELLRAHPELSTRLDAPGRRLEEALAAALARRGDGAADDRGAADLPLIAGVGATLLRVTLTRWVARSAGDGEPDGPALLAAAFAALRAAS